MASTRSATSSCRQSSAQRRAALAGAVEGRGERHRATTCSARAEESTTRAFCPPVSATSGTGRPSGFRRSRKRRWISRATSVEPVNTTPRTRASPTSRAPTCAVAGQQLQHARRHAGLVQQARPPGRRSAASPRRAWPARRCRRPSAAATWPVKIASGKFQGEMQATGPSATCGGVSKPCAPARRSSAGNPRPRGPRRAHCPATCPPRAPADRARRRARLQQVRGT